MGYTTEFKGRFTLNKKLEPEHHAMLNLVADCDGKEALLKPGFPDSYCDWVPTKDGLHLEWNGAEKFYYYEGWLRYIIDNYLKIWGYTLNGTVQWRGEEFSDVGTLIVKDNVLTCARGDDSKETVTVKLPRRVLEAYLDGDIEDEAFARMVRKAVAEKR